MVLRPQDWVTTPTFLGSSLQEAYPRSLSLQSHGPAPHSKCPMFLCGEPWLTRCIALDWGIRSYVGDLPGYLLVVVWLPCLVAQLIMTIWSCVWAWIRPANLDSSSLSALCQVFSSQVMTCHVSLMIHRCTLPFTLLFHCDFTALGFLMLRTVNSLHQGPKELFLSKSATYCQDGKSTHVSERLKKTVLPSPHFSALGHTSTRTTFSSAKMRAKDGGSVSLRLIFMLVSHLMGLDSGLCFSHPQVKWHHRFIKKALWSSSI